MLDTGRAVCMGGSAGLWVQRPTVWSKSTGKERTYKNMVVCDYYFFLFIFFFTLHSALHFVNHPFYLATFHMDETEDIPLDICAKNTCKAVHATVLFICL
ncbi:hypothetical protein XENTR_v10001666 [Xenopus tropicalis]|nr:hypothetical protein XENTR_v10001666 [Xenopus tropicalis]